MNKKHFLPLLLGVIMAGCTSDEVITGDGSLPADTEVGTSTGGYLSISIVSAQSTGTRADNDYTEGDGSYQDGTPEENKVKRVRFFFFNGDNAIDVKKNTGSNTSNSYIDWYPSDADNSGSADHTETVEKIMTATLGLSFKSNLDSDKPTSVLAVINPTEEILELNNPDLAELKEVINDYKTGLHASNFVMSNSVYVEETEDNNKAVVYTTAITKDNICQTLEDAVKKPVTIYVERVLARLDFSVNIDNKITDENEEELKNIVTDAYTLYPVWNGKVEDKSKTLYIKLLGWNITATPNKSRLVKEISKSWTTTSLFDDAAVWNSSKYHRSFWALNPDLSNGDFLYGNFGLNDASKDETVKDTDYPASGLAIPGNDSYEKVYLQENANKYSEAMTEAAPYPTTKVIIAAQLTDDEGNAYPLAEWAYKKYTLEGLKTQLVGTVLNNLYFWEKNGDEPIEASSISESDIVFKTADVQQESGDYYVYAVLSKAAEDKKWTIGNAPLKEGDKYLTKDDVNKYIMDAVNHAKVWKNGMTYYYFDVKHLGKKQSEDSECPGEFGIVRNHLYKTTVTSITGLGTPVYDPDRVIYPEKPKDDESIVSAEVKILSWRIVEDNYELTW